MGRLHKILVSPYVWIILTVAIFDELTPFISFIGLLLIFGVFSPRLLRKLGNLLYSAADSTDTGQWRIEITTGGEKKIYFCPFYFQNKRKQELRIPRATQPGSYRTEKVTLAYSSLSVSRVPLDAEEAKGNLTLDLGNIGGETSKPIIRMRRSSARKKPKGRYE